MYSEEKIEHPVLTTSATLWAPLRRESAMAHGLTMGTAGSTAAIESGRSNQLLFSTVEAQQASSWSARMAPPLPLLGAERAHKWV